MLKLPIYEHIFFFSFLSALATFLSDEHKISMLLPKFFLANLVLHDCWNYIFEIDGNMQLKRQAKISAYVVATVQLLQHVLPDHGGRELNDEQEDVDRRRLGDVVLGLKGDL